MTAPEPRPVRRATREETFTGLCTDFASNDLVEDKLLATPMQNLEEFRFFWISEADVAPWIADVVLGDDRRITEARLRRAWHSVRQMGSLREADRTRTETADLEDLLDLLAGEFPGRRVANVPTIQ